MFQILLLPYRTVAFIPTISFTSTSICLYRTSTVPYYGSTVSIEVEKKYKINVFEVSFWKN